jgi:CMP/dCMP kinase
MIVAIDGPAAAGKGTLARRLAEHLGFAYLDTGLLYRATGRKVLDAGDDPADAEAAEAVARGLDADDLAAPGLRTDDVARAASMVAALPGVRAALLDFQRRFAADPPPPYKGAVLDGRDIGTVVCPHAEVKLFVTASDEVRAERRAKELREAGHNVITARVLQEMKERDARDQVRDIAPLVAAPDAVEIDTSGLDADQVFERALALITERNQDQT